MTKKIYLTIDDSPSADTDRLTAFLAARNIPALLYARGAFMEEADGFDKILRAIERGFVIGNHSYAHERTSVIGFDAQTSQIAQTQDLIDKAYQMAGVAQPVKTFRFPHLDRGCGNAWVIDFDKVPDPYKETLQHLFWDGVRLETKELPTDDQVKLKYDMQDWLKQNGFEALPTPDVMHPWFRETEMAQAVDSLITFSTSDWMLTPRHKGNWPYKTIDDLKRKIDDDKWLNRSDSAHIVLMHDDREDLLTVFEDLIKHFLNQNFEFLPILPRS